MNTGKKWTVLIFTLVLVVLWVFMAMATLNLTQRIEYDLQIRQIDNQLRDSINTKSNNIFQYARYLNSTWSGFTDNIGCPTNITLSWSILQSFSTSLVFRDEQIFCESETSYGWELFQVYFNEEFDDTSYLEFDWQQILFNDENRDGIINSFEEIFVDGNASFPLQPDGIDDNFDSDNYMINSTWSILDYPEWYIDNNANHRIHNFWYISPWDEWYNIFWLNQRTTQYIAWNTNNIEPIINIGDVSEWYIYLDINQGYDVRIIRFDRSSFTEVNELIISDDTIMTWTMSWSWFIQSDATILDSDISEFNLSWDEFEFDFSSNDYAIFLRNNDVENILSYQIKIRDSNWEKVYFMPVIDDNEWMISVLWNHIIFSENGIPIGEHREITQQK